MTTDARRAGPPRTLSAAAVDAWLAAMPPTAACGTAAALGNCPLARYLAQSSGNLNWLVTEDCCCIPGDARYDLPAWARQFVAAIDRRGLRAIPAAEARAVLRECTSPNGGHGDD